MNLICIEYFSPLPLPTHTTSKMDVWMSGWWWINKTQHTSLKREKGETETFSSFIPRTCSSVKLSGSLEQASALWQESDCQTNLKHQEILFNNIYFTMLTPSPPPPISFCFILQVCLVIHLHISDFSADLQLLLDWIRGLALLRENSQTNPRLK